MHFVHTPNAIEQPTNSNFEAFGGPWLSYYVCPYGCSSTVLSPNDHPNPSQGQRKGFGKGQIWRKKIQVSLNSQSKNNLGALGGGGGMAQATWAQQPLHPHGCSKYPYCHQIITQTHPRGDQRVSEKVEF